jgi:hypothetical protein
MAQAAEAGRPADVVEVQGLLFSAGRLDLLAAVAAAMVRCRPQGQQMAGLLASHALDCGR